MWWSVSLIPSLVARLPLWNVNLQTGYAPEVPRVLGKHGITVCQSGRRDEQIVLADQLSNRGKLRPNPRVHSGDREIEWQQRYFLDNRLDQCRSPGSPLR